MKLQVLNWYVQSYQCDMEKKVVYLYSYLYKNININIQEFKICTHVLCNSSLATQMYTYTHNRVQNSPESPCKAPRYDTDLVYTYLVRKKAGKIAQSRLLRKIATT